jgi:two-component system OmpR family sensor kinase
MRLTSLRARLLAGVIALAAVCLIVLGGIVYAQQRDFLISSVDDQARSAVAQVNRELTEQGVPDPSRSAPQHQDGAGDGDDRPPGGRGRPPGLALPPGVYGERRSAAGTTLGQVVFGYTDSTPSPPRLGARVAAGQVFTAPSQDGSLEYRVYATRSPDARATTVVAVPLSGVSEQLHRLLAVEGGVIGGVLLLMAGLGWWVVRLGLRPLDRIGATAGRIAAGDLSQRVQPAEDRTEIGRLGLSLNAMLHQIERAFAERTASEERLRRFLADASHELRTPLASIRGYAELYRMGAARDPAGAEKAMSRIEQEAARMGVLVEDLLTLARLDEVRDAVREPVDVTELARDAAEDARAAARDRQIAFRGGDDDTLVLGDGDQLRQVIGNLTRNALVHTPPGTPVEVGVERDDGHVRIVVRDHGPGLPDDDDDGGGGSLFERFWRADAARGRGPAGAGLGLAIVHAIVTAHGGTVRAENAPDGGARFTVELPAA